MTTLSVFERPICCSTGVCGPQVDPALVQFAADVHWIAKQGVATERFNLAQQPQVFASNETVKAMLSREGEACLPLIFVNGDLVIQGRYLSRAELARLVEETSQPRPSIYTEAVAELVAIGAAVGSNCEVCLKYHVDKARKLGVFPTDMHAAIQTAQMVKDTPARSILELAKRLLGNSVTGNELPLAQTGCCEPTASTPVGAKKCC
jgi:AhpD family alkylhydroperoxidase